METTGVAHLKARLSRYLKRVKAGEEVLITERGIPVAKLVPVDGAEARESRRQQLAAAGIIRLGTQDFSKIVNEPPPGTKRMGASVLRALLEDRKDRV